MTYLECLVLVCLLGCAFAEIEKNELLTPCKVSDLDCIRSSTQLFLERTAHGISKYDIRPIDPMHLDSVDYEFSTETGVKHHLKNVTVTGLKNLIVSDLKMTTEAQITMNLDIVAHTDIIAEFTKEKKTFNGHYTISGKGVAIATYQYSVTQKDGVDWFTVGEAKYEYHIEDVPTIKLDDTLLKELENDIETTDTRKAVLEHREEFTKLSLRKILEAAVPTLIHNLKRASHILPKSAFFIE